MDFEFLIPVAIYAGVQIASIMFPQIAWLLAPFRMKKEKVLKDALINGIESYSDYTGDKEIKKHIRDVAELLNTGKDLHKEIMDRSLNMTEQQLKKRN